MPIASMTHSISEFRKDEDGLLSCAISTDFPQRRFYLTLNCGEKPRIPIPSKLSEILVDDPDPKYRLSAKACQGILNRAERRGKDLPPELKAALIEQSACKETELTALKPQDATDLDGDGGVLHPQYHRQTSGVQSVSRNAPVNLGGQGNPLAE